jgi:hypothetical protein
MDYDKIVSYLSVLREVISLTLVQMVLDAGRLVEFDTPSTLLQNKRGLLHALVEQSADKEALYSVAFSTK